MRKLKLIRNLIIILAIGFKLTACDEAPGSLPECVEAYELGELNAAAIQVDATQEDWIATDLYVKSGDPLDLVITDGSLSLCGEDRMMGTDAFPVYGTKSNWQDTTIRIYPGDFLYISVGDPDATNPTEGDDIASANKYTRWKQSWVPAWESQTLSWTDPNKKICSTTDDSGCWYTNGFGMRGRIGSTIFLPTGVDEITGFKNVVDPFTAPTTINTTNNLLGFKIYDTASWASGIGVDNWADNSGGYMVDIMRIGCPRANGEGLMFAISDATPSTTTTGTNFATLKASGTAPSSGYVYVKIDDSTATGGDGIYTATSNTGYYKLRLSTTSNSDTPLSTFINRVVEGESVVQADGTTIKRNGVKPMLKQGREALYTALLTNTFLNIVRIMLVLFVIIYGIAFAFGMLQEPHYDFVVRIAKVSVVLMMFSPATWDLLFNMVNTIFLDSSSYLVHVMSNASNPTPPVWNPDIGIDWGFLDETVGLFFVDTTWIKLLGLICSGWGIIYVIIIIWGMFFYLVMMLAAIITYLLSLIALSVLMILLPFFIALILFRKTKEIFDRWIKEMFYYALLPVVLFTVLVVFNYFMQAAVYRILSYGVCWTCIYESTGICWFGFYMPEGWEAGDDFGANMPIGFAEIVFFIIIVKLTQTFIEFAENMAKALAGTTAGFASITGLSLPMANKAGDKALGIIGQDQASRELGKSRRRYNASDEGKAEKQQLKDEKTKKKEEKKNRDKPK